jgi:hypothetical protein
MYTSSSTKKHTTTGFASASIDDTCPMLDECEEVRALAREMCGQIHSHSTTAAAALHNSAAMAEDLATFEAAVRVVSEPTDAAAVGRATEWLVSLRRRPEGVTLGKTALGEEHRSFVPWTDNGWHCCRGWKHPRGSRAGGPAAPRRCSPRVGQRAHGRAQGRPELAHGVLGPDQ